MAGTAEYQVGSNSRHQSKKCGALNPGVQTTLAPAASDANNTPINPLTWNRGITLRHRSHGVRSSVATTLLIDAARLACVSGTILGRAVVPDVNSTSASSSGCARTGRESAGAASRASVNIPA